MSAHVAADLWREVTYLAYHLHWPLAELLELEHRDREELVAQVGDLNERAWREALQRAG